MPIEFLRESRIAWSRLEPEWNTCFPAARQLSFSPVRISARMVAASRGRGMAVGRTTNRRLEGGRRAARDCPAVSERARGGNAVVFYRQHGNFRLFGCDRRRAYIIPLSATVLLDALGTMPAIGISNAGSLSTCAAASPTVPQWKRTRRRRGWKAECQSLQICPVLALPRSWEEYLAGLDKKDRHEIRRKLRRGTDAEEPHGIDTSPAPTRWMSSSV